MERGSRYDAEFREFVSARWPVLVNTAFLITLDRGIAEDCVQEALTSVHRRWRRLQTEGNPAAYVHRSVINAALSWRQKRRIREIPLTAGVQPAASTSGTGDPAHQLTGDLGAEADLFAALRTLPPRMRAVIVLRHLEDRSEAETAALLGCAIGTVKSLGSRGIARLRESLRESQSEPGRLTEGGRR